MSISKLDIPHCFSANAKCVSMSDHVLRAQRRQLLATRRQHISRLCQSSLRSVVFFFRSPAKLQNCYWRNL
jgi:hypothetical protein